MNESSEAAKDGSGAPPRWSPAPWRAVARAPLPDLREILDADGEGVALVAPNGGANAALLAAAPQLLRLLAHAHAILAADEHDGDLFARLDELFQGEVCDLLVALGVLPPGHAHDPTDLPDLHEDEARAQMWEAVWTHANLPEQRAQS
jgi:hypothetical protein